MFLRTTFHKLIIDSHDPYIEKLNIVTSAVLDLLDFLMDRVQSSCFTFYSVFVQCCKHLDLTGSFTKHISPKHQFFLVNAFKFVLQKNTKRNTHQPVPALATIGFTILYVTFYLRQASFEREFVLLSDKWIDLDMILELKNYLPHQILAFFLKVIFHLLRFVFQRTFKLHNHKFSFELLLIVVELKCLLSIRIFLKSFLKLFAPSLDEESF